MTVLAIRMTSLSMHAIANIPIWLLALGPIDWFFIGQLSGQIYVAVMTSFFCGFYGFHALSKSYILLYLLNFVTALWSWSCLFIQHILFVFPDIIWAGLTVALTLLILQDVLTYGVECHRYDNTTHIPAFRQGRIVCLLGIIFAITIIVWRLHHL